jgi:hypothetical protein
MFTLNNLANSLKFINTIYRSFRHIVEWLMFDQFKRHVCDRDRHNSIKKYEEYKRFNFNVKLKFL